MRDLSDKQQRFAQEYIVDSNATQAAIRAGYAVISAKVSGHNCITNYNVRHEITRLQAKLEKKTAYTQETGLAKLLHAYDVAERLRQPSAMVSAAVGANRMHGFDKDANIGEKTVIIISPKVVKAIESTPIEPQEADTDDKE